MIIKFMKNPEKRLPLIKFRDSNASEVRYGDCAVKNWGEYDVIWEESENDYQGYAKFLLRSPQGAYVYYSYSYGSCSGCDTWESAGYTEQQICNEMISESLVMRNNHELSKWRNMLADATGSYDAPLVKAIQTYLNIYG